MDGSDGNIDGLPACEEKVLFFSGDVVLDEFGVLVGLFFDDQTYQLVPVHYVQ